MRKTALAGLAALIVLTGCESRFNPFNWFGASDEASLPLDAATAQMAAPIDPRPTVDQIAGLTVDRVPGGALVTAIGLPSTQGWYRAALIPVTRDSDGQPRAEGSTIAFRFAAIPPRTAQPAGPAQSREISAGIFLSDQTLQGVRTISVRGARNERTSRR